MQCPSYQRTQLLGPILTANRLIESLQEITSHLTSTLPCRFLLRQSHKTYFSCRVVGLGCVSSIPPWSRRGTKRVARSSFRPETRCPSDRRAPFSSSTVNSNTTSLHTRSRSSSPVWPRIASAIAPGAIVVRSCSGDFASGLASHTGVAGDRRTAGIGDSRLTASRTIEGSCPADADRCVTTVLGSTALIREGTRGEECCNSRPTVSLPDPWPRL